MNGSDQTLPKFGKMTRKALFTIRRGVKIGTSDLNLRKTFTHVSLEQDRVRNYSEFFDFNSFPMTYLYILAQRAQLSLMLEKEFTIAIPGMIHLTNDLRIVKNIEPNEAFNLEVECNVPTKEYGSLLPNLQVNYFQNDQIVATCSSGYLAKRKKPNKTSSKSKKTHVPQELPSEIEPLHKESWELSKNLGKEYAKVSGDNNPIHKSKWFAKFAGFKRPIIHGWYSVTRVTKSAEKLIDDPKQVTVNFMQPILLPSTVYLKLYRKGTENEVQYVVYSSDEVIHLTGKIE